MIPDMDDQNYLPMPVLREIDKYIKKCHKHGPNMDDQSYIPMPITRNTDKDIKEYCKNIPNMDYQNYIPKPIIGDTDKNLKEHYKHIPTKFNNNEQTLMACHRFNWLVSTFKANGQKCNMHQMIEASYLGENLYYSNETESNKKYSRPSSPSSSKSSSFS